MSGTSNPPPKDQAQRVFLYAVLGLAALVFLGSKFILGGVVAGGGMFLFMFVVITWWPGIWESVLKMGKWADVGFSFGVPLVISKVLEIQGVTMLIACITAGLMFTMVVSMSKLGGVTGALRGTLGELRKMWEEATKENEDDPMDRDRTGSGDRPGSGGQRKEGEQESQEG